MKFKVLCLKCRRQYRLLARCKQCGVMICVECMIKSLCIDCFIIIEHPIILADYYEKKIEKVII